MHLFYLDNLDSGLSIDPFAIPQVKYFHKSVTEKLIRAHASMTKPELSITFPTQPLAPLPIFPPPLPAAGAAAHLPAAATSRRQH
jgi:hypothetical protein